MGEPLVDRTECAARHRARRPDARSVRPRSHRPSCGRGGAGAGHGHDRPRPLHRHRRAGRHARRRRRAVAPLRRGDPPRAGHAVDPSRGRCDRAGCHAGWIVPRQLRPRQLSSTTTHFERRSTEVTSPAPGSTSPSPSRSLPTIRSVATRGSSSLRTSPRTPRSDVCACTATPSTTPSPCSPASAGRSCPSSASRRGARHDDAAGALGRRGEDPRGVAGDPFDRRRRDDRTHRLRLRVRRPAARCAGLRRLRRSVPSGPDRRLDADRPGAVERTRCRRQGPRRRCRRRHRADGEHRRTGGGCRPCRAVPAARAPEASDRRCPVPDRATTPPRRTTSSP